MVTPDVFVEIFKKKNGTLVLSLGQVGVHFKIVGVLEIQKDLACQNKKTHLDGAS